MKLEIDEIAAPRSFIFLWCGSGEGLDLGRVVRGGRGVVGSTWGQAPGTQAQIAALQIV